MSHMAHILKLYSIKITLFRLQQNRRAPHLSQALTGFESPTIPPFTTMFHKWVKKLTKKAVQAVAEGTQKLKRKVSTSSQEPSLAKKLKHIPSSESEESSPPPRTISQQATIQTEEDHPRTMSQRATVQTEEEDGISPWDTINVGSNMSSDDAEASEAELGKLFILSISIC